MPNCRVDEGGKSWIPKCLYIILILFKKKKIYIYIEREREVYVGSNLNGAS